MIRVMVADDQAMVRTGFGMIIGAQPDMELVGEAADGVQAVALARRVHPDVALLDIRMPRMDGLEALRLLAGPGVTDPVKVVMEALTNVRQHAGGARRVDVWVVRTSDWLLVRVTDDGPGPRGGLSRDRQGFGLAGMTERVGAIGGRLRAGPGIAGGWVVDAALPLDRERAR